MDDSHKQEIMREGAKEERQEPMNVWIEENKEYLMTEFIDEHEYAFDEFCQEEYKTHND